MEYYSAIKNEIIPFVAMWIHLEIIILSEVSQIKTNITYHLYVESKKMTQMNYLQNRNSLTDTENNLMGEKKKQKNCLIVTKGEWDKIRSLGLKDAYWCT